MPKDLFETLQGMLDCTYISDLYYSPLKDIAKAKLSRMDLSSYSLNALQDAAQYFYGTKIEFGSLDEATQFFQNQSRVNG